MEPALVDYVALTTEAAELQGEELISYWIEQLPYFCRDEYLASTLRPTDILRVTHGAFEYVFDHYTQFEANGTVPYSTWEEDRLIVVCGRSCQPRRPRRRDDTRLRRWIGRTEKALGTGWDKGHFIAHALGGAVDGMEVNVFVQRRDFNRGWSAQGKVYRHMEAYCASHAGTFCFSRPLYADGSARPAWVDFGLLMEDGQLWVERFDNR